MITSSPPVVSLVDLVQPIGDGTKLALPPDYSGCAMAAMVEILRRRPQRLHLVGTPTIGLQGDWLIGAGLVATVETAAMTLGEYGLPPRFQAALKARQLTMLDATCPAIHTGLQAAEKGVPFLPIRGILGSDLLRNRPDWKVIDNPFADGRDPIVLIPAIKPDVAIFHARAADRNGNVWIGVRRELMVLAHASRTTLVTVERIEDRDFLEDDEMAAGTIPALYISAIAEAQGGASPVGLNGAYPADDAAILAYVSAARSSEGFSRWLEEIVGETVSG